MKRRKVREVMRPIMVVRLTRMMMVRAQTVTPRASQMETTRRRTCEASLGCGEGANVVAPSLHPATHTSSSGILLGARHTGRHNV